MVEEFGSDYAHALSRDLVLAPLGNRTAEESIEAGLPVREVWVALCREMDVPSSKWYGAGQVRRD
jgi:hypothetical protein